MLLEVKDLDISYGDKLTVTGASLELDKGEIMSIVGESGSGKTTVIRAIMGCLPGAGRVSRGSIIFDGKDVLQNTPDEWRKMYGSEMSMIFQDSGNMINPIRASASSSLTMFRRISLTSLRTRPIRCAVIC